MKYTVEIDINQPRERVIELFDSTENLYKWQCDLESFKHVSGDPGQVGAVSELVYQMGKRRIEMTETITKRALPDEFWGTYEAKGMWNEIRNYFIEKEDGTTHWKMDSEFKGKGFMKIMLALMPGAFKKQTLKFMNNFKDFAEAN